MAMVLTSYVHQFYENNVNVLTDQFAPRGYVSPIADGALGFTNIITSAPSLKKGKRYTRYRLRQKKI